jgi:hypothetical protein
VLTQYLNAMARFHNYSFGNIMLIALHTCCFWHHQSPGQNRHNFF